MTNTTAAQPLDLDRNTIREIFIRHGFTIKDGQTDLKPYVYEAAEALIAQARTARLVEAAQAILPGEKWSKGNDSEGNENRDELACAGINIDIDDFPHQNAVEFYAQTLSAAQARRDAVLSAIQRAARLDATASASGEREGWEAAAKALSERAAGHFRNKNYTLQHECRQCASMLHDMKPALAPVAAQQAAAVAAPSEQQANVMPPTRGTGSQLDASEGETLDQKAENALLWCYRRLKNSYGRLPFVEEAVAGLRERTAAAGSARQGGNTSAESCPAGAATTSEDARDAALEEAANAVASTNTLGMTAASAITKLCANIRALKSESAMRATQQEGGK